MPFRSVVLALLLCVSMFGRARTFGYCQQGGQIVVTGAQQSGTMVQQSYPQCSIKVFYTGGASGTVATNGTVVTWLAGTLFNANSGWPGLTITINSIPYPIISVSSPTSITLASSAGLQPAVSYSMPPTAPAAIYSDNAGTPLGNPFTASRTGYWGYYADNGTYDVQASGSTIPVPFTWGAISIIDPSMPTNTIFCNPETLTAYVTPCTTSQIQTILATAFLSKFQLGLSQSSTRVVRIEMMGDSYQNSCAGEGGPGPTNCSSLYPNGLAAALVNAGYPSHGTGVIPLLAVVGGTGLNAAYYTASGSSYSVSALIGPQQAAGSLTGGSIIVGTTGTIITMASETYDHITVYCAQTTGNAGWTVSIDASNVGTACAASGTTGAFAQSFAAPGGLGSHVAVLTALGAAYVYAMEGTVGTTGVSVDRLATGGASAEWMAGHTQFSDLATGQILTVAAFGDNEIIHSVPSPTVAYTTNMNTIIAHQLALSSQSVSVIGESAINPGAYSGQPAMIAAGLAVANSNAVDFLSFYALMPLYAAGDAIGLYFTDNIHYTDSGQLLLTSLINTHLLGYPPTGVTTNGSPVNCVQASGTVSPVYPACFSGYNSQTNGQAKWQMTTPTGSIQCGITVSGQSENITIPAGDYFCIQGTTFSDDIAPTGRHIFASTVGAGFSAISIQNTSTVGSDSTAYVGDMQTFLTGSGNSAEATYGVANCWFVYDITNSALRLKMCGDGNLHSTEGITAPAFQNTSPGTVAALPSCATGTLGVRLEVNDANSKTPGTTAAGSGTYTIAVQCIYNSSGSAYTWIID